MAIYPVTGVATSQPPAHLASVNAQVKATGVWLFTADGVTTNLVKSRRNVAAAGTLTNNASNRVGAVIGRNLNGLSSGQAIPLGSCTELFDTTNQICTILVVARRNGSTGERGLWFTAGGGAGGFACVPANAIGGAAADVWQAQTRGGGPLVGAGGGIDPVFVFSSVPEVYVFTANAGLLEAWQNGVKTGSGSPGTGSTPTGTWYLSGEGWDAFTSTDSSFYLAATWNRALSPNQIISLCANPWQIFEDPFASFFYTPAASGVSGSLTVTLADATLAAAGTQTILGTLAQTLANTTSAAAGTTTILGTLSLNLSDTTLAASGSVGSPATGSVAETLDDATLSAAGTTTILGIVAQTLANVTSAASGTTTIVGSAAITLGNDTLAASGSVGSAVSGSVVLTLANTTLAAAGTTTILGSVNYTTENTVSTAAGTTQILGTLNVTLGNATLVATGTSGTTASGAEWRFLKLWISKLGF